MRSATSRMPGRVLDVGCAAGYFLRVMKEEGWDVTGASSPRTPSGPRRPRADRRRERPRRAAARQVELRRRLLRPDHHVGRDRAHPRPRGGLWREVRRLLEPGRQAPDRDPEREEPRAKVLGKRWQHYKHAEHIYHFHPKHARASSLDKRRVRRSSRTGPGSAGSTCRWGSSRSGPDACTRCSRPCSRRSSCLSSNAAVYVNLLDEMIVVASPEAVAAWKQNAFRQFLELERTATGGSAAGGKRVLRPAAASPRRRLARGACSTLGCGIRRFPRRGSARSRRRTDGSSTPTSASTSPWCYCARARLAP